MAKDSWIDSETAPMGKRTVRRNSSGVLKGYIGRTQWETIAGFGVQEYSEAEGRMAAAWVAGRDDWQDAAWEG